MCFQWNLVNTPGALAADQLISLFATALIAVLDFLLLLQKSLKRKMFPGADANIARKNLFVTAHTESYKTLKLLGAVLITFKFLEK